MAKKKKKTKPHNETMTDYEIWYHKYTTTGTPAPPAILDGSPEPEYSTWRQHYIDTGGNPTTPPPPPPK